MIGAGEAFFAAFALSKGFGEIYAGLIIGLPMMMGASLQTFTPFLFERLGRPKRWVLLMASLQALSLLALAFSSVTPEMGVKSVFIFTGLYWACSFASASAWNYWMGFVVPVASRTEFFALRLRLTQYGTMFGLLIAGVLLQQGEVNEWGARSYLIPFLCAFIFRIVAVILMNIQDPIQYERSQDKLRMSVVDFFHQGKEIFLRRSEVRRDLTFLFLFNVAIYISSSFVSPFLLAKLRFDYLSFMATQLALYVGKVGSLTVARRWVEKIGVKQVLFWGALGMAPLPAVWTFVDHTYQAVILQFVSGFSWGFFEVAVSLLLFSELPHQDKIQLLTWNNFFQTLAILIGTLIGGKILGHFNEMFFGYFLIFTLGSTLRVFLVLAHRPKKLLNSR